MLRAKYIEHSSEQGERNGSTFSDDENSKYTFTLLAQQVRDAAMNSSVVAAATSSTHRMMASSHLPNSSDLTQVSQQIQQMKEMEYRLKQQIKMQQQQQQQQQQKQ